MLSVISDHTMQDNEDSDIATDYDSDEDSEDESHIEEMETDERPVITGGLSEDLVDLIKKDMLNKLNLSTQDLRHLIGN